MKKTLLALALTGTFGVAAAQALNTGLPAANKPVVNTGTTTTAVVAQAATPGKTDPHVNPFNGKLQSAEQIQRELEQARVETQMLEERLKQTNLAEELKTVPLRKAVEVAQATTAVKKEEASQKEIEAAMRAPKVPPATTARASAAPAIKPVPVKKPRTVVKPTTKEAVVNRSEGSQAAPVPTLPRPTLVSVMAVGNARSAVLDVAGGTMVVSDGESTPYGVLKVRDKDSIELGGATFRVHNATMARFVVSDAKAVAQPGSSIQGGPAAVATPPVVAPTPQPVVNTTTPLPAQANGPLPALPLPPGTPAAAATPGQEGIGPKAQMPSLQLPPGVNLLPPSR